MKFNLFILPTIPATYEERKALRPIGRNNDRYFGGFGFFEAFRFPGETTPVPLTYERMIEAKYALLGTVDDIKRDIESMVKDTNVEWFGWYFDQGMMSWDETRRQLESFAKIIPEFKG